MASFFPSEKSFVIHQFTLSNSAMPLIHFNIKIIAYLVIVRLTTLDDTGRHWTTTMERIKIHLITLNATQPQ